MVMIRGGEQAEVSLLLEDSRSFLLFALLLLILLNGWTLFVTSKPLRNQVLPKAARSFLKLPSCLHRLKFLQLIGLSEDGSI